MRIYECPEGERSKSTLFPPGRHSANVTANCDSIPWSYFKRDRCAFSRLTPMNLKRIDALLYKELKCASGGWRLLGLLLGLLAEFVAEVELRSVLGKSFKNIVHLKSL